MESTQSLPEPVRNALDRGNLVEAIKLLRASGMDATAIKEGVDAYMRRKVRPAGAQEKAVTKSQPFVPRPTDDSLSYTNPANGLSPGQVPDSNQFWVWIIAIAVAALVGVVMYGCAAQPLVPPNSSHSTRLAAPTT
ncbi:MAG: hypothetical protein H7255_11150 [Ramlibacter sp.]|nr:hypothetical protein [Ramlibacter sp.]